MFDYFRHGSLDLDRQPMGSQRQFRPMTGGVVPPFAQTGGMFPAQQFHPMLGGNHPAMQVPQFNTGGNLPPQSFAPMTGGNMPAHPMTGVQPMGGLAGLFRRGMY